MKAWLLNGFGLDNLQLGETTTPALEANEVLIEVGAVSLNFRDKAILEGIYEPSLVPKPLIPVSDVAGRIVAVGPGVTHLKEGDRVNSHLYSTWVDGPPPIDDGKHAYGSPRQGGLAEYMVLSAATAVRVPESMSDREAATLPIAALTVWYALTDKGQLQPGETVLVQGTGGTSIFAIQIATALGAKVIATSSSDEKLDRVKELGASATINYREFPNWERRALELTDGLGVDHLMDVAGGDGLNQSVQATRPEGQIHQIGFLTGLTSHLELLPMIFRRTVIRAACVGPSRSFERMNQFLHEKAIRPVIDTVYGFDQAREAYEHLARGAFGKIVIDVAD